MRSFMYGPVPPLHTSKRMHFIEEAKTATCSAIFRQLAYVKTYALH